jgi:excisionase family DNA binding protein
MRELLGVKEVAGELEVSTRLVRAWIESGELRAIQVGRNRCTRRPVWRVERAELDAFIAGRKSLDPERSPA